MSNGMSSAKIVPSVNLNSMESIKQSIIVGSLGPAISISSNIPNGAISKITRGKNSTSVISNTTNLLVTDIIVDGVSYFYKTPKDKPVKVIRDSISKIRVGYHEDDNYIYTETDNLIEILHEDNTYSEDRPVEIFLNEAYKQSNRYYLDNKTYSVKTYYSLLKVTYNSPNVSITTNGLALRVRNISNIIHVDSFSFNNSRLIISSRVESPTDNGEISYSNSELRNLFNVTNDTRTAPFLPLRNIIEIKEKVVLVKLYLLDNSIQSLQYSINGELLHDDTTPGSQFISNIKVKPNADIVYAVIDKYKPFVDPLYCGETLLSTSLESRNKLYNNQTYLYGLRNDNIVSFDISDDILLANSILLSAVDEDNNTIDSVILEGVIYCKSNSRVGIKYDDRMPGIYI